MIKQLFAPLVALTLALSASVASAQDAPAVPNTQPPTEAVPGPPAAPPPPVVAEPVAPSPTGQWVYTSQYGWLWEPYGQPYTYVNDNIAYTYAYYPAYGWRWLYSPWVIGFGPEPYWGVRGWGHFAWYGAYGYRGGYHGVYGVRGPGRVGGAGRGYYRGAPGRGAVHSGGGHAFHGGGHGHR